MAAQKDSFIRVNPEWQYQIQLAQNTLQFQYQPQTKTWMSFLHAGEDFRLLRDKTVMNLLNEALYAGLAVVAVQPATKQQLTFLKAPKLA